MTTTERNGQSDMVDMHSHCIVGCDWLDVEGDHGDYCERTVGGRANAVTEPGWLRTEFWCSVIRSHIRGRVTAQHLKDCERYREGVQLVANVWGEVPAVRRVGDYQELQFNLTVAEARQLAAMLTAAADDNDNRGDTILKRRLEKIADHLGANIFGP